MNPRGNVSRRSWKEERDGTAAKQVSEYSNVSRNDNSPSFWINAIVVSSCLGRFSVSLPQDCFLREDADEGMLLPIYTTSSV